MHGLVVPNPGIGSRFGGVVGVPFNGLLTSLFAALNIYLMYADIVVLYNIYHKPPHLGIRVRVFI